MSALGGEGGGGGREGEVVWVGRVVEDLVGVRFKFVWEKEK